MPRFQCLALVTCLLLPAVSDAQIKLAWKLTANDPFFVEETTAVRQTLRAREESFEHSYRHSKLSRFSVKTKNEDGSLVLEQEIIKLKAESTGRESKSDFGVNKLEGGKLLFTLNPQMRIAKMEGFDALSARFSGASASLVQQSLTAQSLQTPVEMLFAFVPDKDVEGKSWPSTNVFGFGPLGQFSSKNTCTLEQAKPADKMKIDVQSVWQFAEASGEQLKLMKIAGVRVDKHKAGGTLLFNADAGRALRCDFTYSVQGVMAIALPNSVEMDFQQQGDIALRIMDKMPEQK